MHFSTTRGMVLPPLEHTANGSSCCREQQQEEQQQRPPQQQEQQQHLHWLCAGIGRACVGRAEMFRLQHGVAVELTQRLYDVPSLNGNEAWGESATAVHITRCRVLIELSHMLGCDAAGGLTV